MNRLEFINKRLHEQNTAGAYINNTNEAMLEYYRIFEKKIKPQFSNFYHASEAQKNGELLFVVVVTGLATYALYKYLKQNDRQRETISSILSA